MNLKRIHQIKLPRNIHKNIVTYMAQQYKIKIVRTTEFEQWLIVQSAKTQALIESRLFRLEYYHHFGEIKSLGVGCYELRFKNGLRIYFVYLSSLKVLILHGGNKNGQGKDIKRAKALIEQYTEEEAED
jgi:putative addiction module killer protein